MLLWPASALAGHGLEAAHLDHPAAPFAPPPPPSSNFNAGGEGATWEVIDTIATGNPHTDLDFFSQNGEQYLSAGTLAAGPNSGGQSIVQLTDGGDVAPALISAQPSASCVSDPSLALSLQHDVEATPKGGAPLNIRNPLADDGDAQLLIDATDAPGRCHDQGDLGVEGAPQGGLEIIDITNVAAPVEIGLTSHIGEAHTVNVDPKRPHIGYAVTSDSTGLKDNGHRTNERADGDPLSLDGFEVVDFSSCMNLGNINLKAKRKHCRPEVYRYRYPSVNMSVAHTDKDTIYGCHELEVYPSDLLTCGSGQALIVLDMSNAFDDNGTPNDYTDDTPRGDPLRCDRRASTSLGPFATRAKVTDCVNQPDGRSLGVSRWLRDGAPSLEGVRWVGSIHHQGRGAGGSATPAYDSTEDIDFNHEAEISHSGRYLFATDERGGGVAPPGATCSPGGDNTAGNGGIHAYRTHRLTRERPNTPKQAFRPYAKTPQGDRAIFRAPINTPPESTFCTAHVFQQIPGQNRIFMGWYSQGTHVVDYREKKDGRIRFIDRAYLIPENANTWTSHVFDWEQNEDGTFTYYGATGDFNFGAAGRSAIDVYKVTLPPAPSPKPPTAKLCNRQWEIIHDSNGAPFASKSDCLNSVPG